MTQSFNLSQLANNLDSSGRLDAADGLVNAVPIANGGTGATTASAARTNLDVAQAVYSVPVGGIIMWSGSVASIPVGWLLCNGASGTPDLRDRFVLGAGSTYAVASTGGSANAIVVSHSHSITDAGHNHLLEATNDGIVGGTNNLGPGSGTNFLSTSATSTVTTGITINTTGASGTNANLPPFYALAFIMKS